MGVFIYALIDPRDNLVRYIGKTINPYGRFKAHLNEKPNRTRKYRWLNVLKSEGLVPILKILEEVNDTDWRKRETYYIQKYKDNNKLCNHTDGGDGVHNPDKSTKVRMSIARKKVWLREGFKEKMLEISRSTGRRQKISAALKGKPHSEEHIFKLPQNQKGYKHNLSDERIQNLVDQMKGNKYMLGKRLSKETKQLIADKLKGNTHTLNRKMPDIEKENRSKAQIGIAKSDEHKSKIGYSMKEAWKNRNNNIVWPDYSVLLEELKSKTTTKLAEELGVKVGTLVSKLNREKKKCKDLICRKRKM